MGPYKIAIKKEKKKDRHLHLWQNKVNYLLKKIIRWDMIWGNSLFDFILFLWIENIFWPCLALKSAEQTSL